MSVSKEEKKKRDQCREKESHNDGEQNYRVNNYSLCGRVQVMQRHQ